MLRSSGSYCGKVDEQEDSAGRMLVAFYLDKVLQRPLVRGPTDNYGTSEPLIANEKFYVMVMDTRTLHGNWYPPGSGPNYSAYLDGALVANDLHQWYGYPTCDFRIFAKKGEQ